MTTNSNSKTLPYYAKVDLGHFKTSQSIKFATFFLQRPFIEWKDLHIIDAVQLYLDFVQDYNF